MDEIKRLKIAIAVVDEQWDYMKKSRKPEHIDREFGMVADWLELCLHREERDKRFKRIVK